MEQLQQFHEIVSSLLKTDNTIREAAEKQYNAVGIVQKTQLLFQLGQDASVGQEVRDMSLVLLRRLVADKYEDIKVAMPNELEDFKAKVIEAVGTESVSSLRKRWTDVLSDVARQTVDDDGNQTWGVVIEFIGHCASSDNAGLLETAMVLIENVPNIFGNQQHQLTPDIKKMFKLALLHQGESSVRTAAVRAYSTFIVDNDEDEPFVREFADLIPDVLKVCEHATVTESDDDVPLQCMIDLASSIPKYLQPHFPQIFTLCLQTIANTEKDESYRQSSMEILVSLCETAPALVRKKAGTFIQPLVANCLNLMTELDEDVSEWLQVDDLDDDIEEEMVTLGETSIDRISCALGPKPIFSPAYTAIAQFIQSPDWKHRYAGLFGLSTIGEGCKRQMEPQIHRIVNEALIPMLQDSHPRVRYAACNAIGQMSSDFGPTLQKKCHEVVVPGLLERAVDLDYPRVAAHALAAFVNFSEDCPKNILNVYLDQIMEKMQWILDQTFHKLVNDRKKIVLLQVITTVASIADTAQEHFSKYYAALIPPLKYILANSGDKELSELRGKTIECISLIGLAVGRDLFAADIGEIMEHLMKAISDDEENENTSYVISAWARICRVLGAEFATYLEGVIPYVLKAADFNPELSILADDDEKDDNDWDVVDFGSERLGIHTAGIEDKNTACEMLVCFVREMKTAFAPYVDEVFKFMEGQIRFIFHDGVRQSAAEIMPLLLSAAQPRGIEYQHAMWQQLLPTLLEALSSESDHEVSGELLYSLGSCVEVLGKNVVGSDELVKIVEVIHAQFVKYDRRRQEREKASRDEDADDETQEEIKEVIEMEASIVMRFCDTLHCLFKTFGGDFMPFFEPLAERFSKMLLSQQTYQDRQWALCVFDDVIEFGGAPGAKYVTLFIEPILKALNDNYPEVRQAAAYGVGCMAFAQKGIYTPYLATAVNSLVAMISRPDARATEESTIATENAISAVAKILKYGEAVDANLVIPTFVSWLPVWEDSEETPFVYDYYCDLIEANHDLVLGPDNKNLPHIVDVVLRVFANEGIDDSTELAVRTKQRLINIIKLINANKELFAHVLESLKLNIAMQQALDSILSSPA